MYYPYLRGKQFDLLALKEALQRGVLSEKIQPVIEPVRDSATLKNVVELFQSQNHVLTIIKNPQVGQFKLFDHHLHTWQVKENSSLYQAQIITPTNYQELIEDPPAVIIFDGQHQPRDPAIWQALIDTKSLFLIPDTSRIKILLPKNKIIVRDQFQTHRHVEAYGDKIDDFFSDDYLYFEEDGYSGFSDFTIEGSRYFDKGFPSRALALHLTYVDAYGNIRIKHFVSDSNDSAKNQSLKFMEAAEKMFLWTMRNHQQLLITEGLLELVELYQQEKFPGLGVLKKWTLMHHLELISQLLDHPNDWLRNYSRVDELYARIKK
ncbi:phage tail protein [Enterococcus hirae]|nr:phage tail protein [Enterococcus hirae]